ncbi:MAG: hypothetical protein JJU01_10485 [Alkalibacterium sp.]|nr:hypothetical protein [Alkalibacterium sp.]
MKLQFFLDRVRRDLGLVPERFIESEGVKMVKLEDVMKVVQRWETALETEDTLTREAQRFEDLLNKDGALTRAEHKEAFDLLMMIHMPLIEGANDVMGYRLKDVDYYRLNNKVLGLEPDYGLADYEEKYNDMIAERNAAEQKRKQSAQLRKKAKEEAEQAKLAKSIKRYMDGTE